MIFSSLSFFVNFSKTLRPAKALSLPISVGLRGPLHAAKRCRPLRLRRDKTARPALERIRIRKPWVFLRRRRFG